MHKVIGFCQPCLYFALPCKTIFPEYERLGQQNATSCHLIAYPSHYGEYRFTLQAKTKYQLLIIQKEAFEEMAAKFSRFAERVDALLAKQGGKSLNRWMDNQEVCQQLNISPRTLQTLRDNGTLAYQGVLQAGGCAEHRKTN